LYDKETSSKPVIDFSLLPSDSARNTTATREILSSSLLVRSIPKGAGLNSKLATMSSLQYSTHNPRYYFAFGSNMHIKQMAARCPESTLVARAVLQGYRWQINERGVANIVQSKPGEPDIVEGILFSVSSKDERTLDRNEGVSKKFYERVLLTVAVEPLKLEGLRSLKTATAADALEEMDSEPGRFFAQTTLSRLEEPEQERVPKEDSMEDAQSNVPQPGSVKPIPHLTELKEEETPMKEAAEDSQSKVSRQGLVESIPQPPRQESENQVPFAIEDKSSSRKSTGADLSPPDSAPKGERVPQLEEALVYVSNRYNKDGPIRKEYVQRMESAMTDALKLGVSESYLQTYLCPCVFGDQKPEAEHTDSEPKRQKKAGSASGGVHKRRPSYQAARKDPAEFERKKQSHGRGPNLSSRGRDDESSVDNIKPAEGEEGMIKKTVNSVMAFWRG